MDPDILAFLDCVCVGRWQIFTGLATLITLFS